MGSSTNNQPRSTAQKVHLNQIKLVSLFYLMMLIAASWSPLPTWLQSLMKVFLLASDDWWKKLLLVRAAVAPGLSKYLQLSTRQLLLIAGHAGAVGHSPSATSNINTEQYDIMCSESAFNRLPIVRPHTQFAISLPHTAAGLDVLQTLVFGLERAAKHEKGLLSETDRPCSDSG